MGTLSGIVVMRVVRIFIFLHVFQVAVSITCVGPPRFDDYTDDGEDEEYPLPLDFRQHLNTTLKGTKCQKPRQQYRTYRRLSQGGVVPLSCGRCLVSDVQVKVSHGTECVGRTPEIYSSKLNCLWKNSCLLEYSPLSSILTPDGRFDCLLRTPDQLDVGFSCVNTAKTPIVDVIPTSKVKAGKGLLRSHDRSIRAKYPTDSLQPRKHVMTLEAPDSKMVSYVLVKALSHNTVTGDRLSMTTESCPIPIDKWTRTADSYDHNITTHSLDFEFTVRDDSEGHHGFDICFQWFSRKDTNPTKTFKQTVDLCDLNRKIRSNREGSDGFPVVDMIKIVDSKAAEGIIRSHATYPWNYRHFVKKSRLQEFLQPSWTSLYRKLEAPADKTRIRVTVKNMSLGRRDRLLLVGDDGKPIDDFGRRTIPTTSLLVNFTVEDSSEPTAAGFLLYYQWLTWDEDRDVRFELRANICKRSTKQAPSECRKKKRKRGGKNKRRKDKKNKKKRKKKNGKDKKRKVKDKKKKRKDKKKNKKMARPRGNKSEKEAVGSNMEGMEKVKKSKRSRNNKSVPKTSFAQTNT